MDDAELKAQVASFLLNSMKTVPKATDYGDNLDQGTIKQISKYDYFTRPIAEKATEIRDFSKHFIPGVSDLSKNARAKFKDKLRQEVLADPTHDFYKWKGY